MLPFRRIPCALAAGLAFASGPLFSVEQTQPDPVTVPGEATPAGADKRPNSIVRMWRWGDSQLRGIFDIITPDTQGKDTWKLFAQVRVQDAIKSKQYVRTPFGFVYGFNARTDCEVEFDGYFANPWDDANGLGISNIRAQLKRRWKPTQGSLINAASGLNVVRPIPDSPDELNDGMNRYGAFLSFSRTLSDSKNYEGLLNLSYDFMTPSRAGGTFNEDHPPDDFFRISPGLLYHRGRATWGLAAGWSHTVDGEPLDFFSLTPSLIYEVPPKYAFNSPGRWQVGFAVEGKHYRDKFDAEFRVRVRWIGDIVRVYKDWRDQRRATQARAGSGDR